MGYLLDDMVLLYSSLQCPFTFFGLVISQQVSSQILMDQALLDFALTCIHIYIFDNK